MSNATTRRPRTKVDPNETPDVKFTRLANQRGEKFLQQMTLLNRLVTSYAYKVDAELGEKLLKEFEEKFMTLKASWEKSIQKIRTKSETATKAKEEPAKS